jgi:hypothetical protein
MSKTVTRIFDSYADAEKAVGDLERLGVSHDDISLVANNSDRAHGDYDKAGEDAGKGATAGGLIGGAGGLLAGLGMLAIPGLGPVVAAGWIASTLVGAGIGAAAGAATGGLIGTLQQHGESEEDAHVYAEGVRRGGTLVSAKVSDELRGEAEAEMTRNRSVDAATRGAAYRQSGWSRFDDTAPEYSAAEVERERGLNQTGIDAGR